ncbi:hypothetical protein MycrhDRAFT_5142 [Mycolicibacterium rhodesiae JS60]|nr:hypothetical protein MycrhDRAFT_5142 [Mycolicibacterium rhodesiae JS60]
MIALFLLLWLGFTIVNASYMPHMLWFSYYSVDYSQGFVRRGLAGEILNLAPADLYFGAVLTIRWLVSALFIVSLAAVAWTVSVRFGRSERRLMLALLTPVLPFGFATAIYSPHPDLLARAALAAFAVTLSWTKDRRKIVFASSVFGLATGVLALIHEAIPLLYSLGAIAVIVVLAAHQSFKIQRLCALCAITPGLVVSLAIALFGRRGISAQLCARVPHDRSRVGQNFIDYHDFVCRNAVSFIDQTPADAVRMVANAGAVALVMSTVLGVLLFAVTILVINHISGVPIARFCNVLRGRLVWVSFGVLLFVPLFVVSLDWTRWWVTISFDVGVVYLLYASSQPEVALPPAARTRILFVVGIILFACFPIGALANVGMRPLV